MDIENEESTVETGEPRSIASDLAAAWDAIEGGSEDVGIDPTEVESGAPASDPTQAAGDSDGSGVPRTQELPQGAPKENVQPALDAAPKSMSPQAREEWAQTPQAVKDHIRDYEKRMEGIAMKHGDAYKRVTAMDKTLAPYQQMFAMNGGAQETIKGLLQTGAALQMGSPQQKAQVAANIIKQFGVDIKALDNLLVGKQVPQEMQQQQQLQNMVNQQVAPLRQQLQQYQQREQQSMSEGTRRVNDELAKFRAENEFFNDVALEVADIMEASANRGREMPLAEAYKIACQAHPEISKIVMAREAQAAASKRQAAASSVSGSPGGATSVPMDRRAQIAAAFDDAGRI